MAATMAAAAALAATVAAPFPVARAIVALEGAKTQTEPKTVPMTTKVRLSATLDKFPDAGTADVVIVDLWMMSYMCMQVVTATPVTEEAAELPAPVSTPLCVAMTKTPHVTTANVVIVELLVMRYMCLKVVTATPVMGETAELSAPVSTPLCMAMTKTSHATTADVVIVELWIMSYMCMQVVMAIPVTKETAALAAPVSTPPCTATSKLQPAPRADAVIVELLRMSHMCMQVVTATPVTEETAELSAPMSTPLCMAMTKTPHATTADVVIVELLMMSHMCMQVVTATPVTKDTAALAAPVSTPPCTATSNMPPAPRADAVIVELLMMSYMCMQVVTATPVTKDAASLAAPASTPPCTATSKLPPAPRADAVIVDLLMMRYMYMQVVTATPVTEETAALAAPASTPPCTATSKLPPAPRADAVIVELLMMRYMCMQVVSATPVMEETAELSAPVSTPLCMAMTKTPHATTADVVIVELLMMRYICMKVVTATPVKKDTAALAAPVSTPPCTATSNFPPAPRADAVIVVFVMMSCMCMQVVTATPVTEQTAALAVPVLTPPCLTMPKWPHARKANAVIVAMLSILHKCSKGPTVMTVTGEAAAQSSPVVTPAAATSTTIDKLPHARTADAVIVEPLLMSHMRLQAPVLMLPAAPSTANERSRPWTAMDELAHARRTDAVLVQLSLMAIM